jgi:hypothetical protein
VKLTAQNLATHTFAQRPISPKPAALIDSQFCRNPPTCVPSYQIKRKPLPDAARERLQELKNEVAEIAPLPQVADERSALIRTATHFEQFVRVRRGGSWLQVDDREKRKRLKKVSVIATDGIAEVKKQAKKVVRHL